MHVCPLRLLIWRATAAVARNLLGVLCPCTAMIQNNKTGLTHIHTQSEEVACQDKKILVCPCCPLPLVYFYFPVPSHCFFLFVCLGGVLPLQSFPTDSLPFSKFSTSLYRAVFLALSLSPSPEHHHPDCKQRWWITNCPALVALGWRQLCGWVDWDMVMSCVCES